MRRFDGFVPALGELFFALASLLTLSAAAQPARFSVPTRVDPCVPIDREKFQTLLAVELGATPDEGKPGTVYGSATVSLTCVDGQVQLELDDAVTRKSMRRRVDLRQVDPSARTRLMALTTAEFVLASWLETRLDKEPDALEPSGPPPSAAAQEQAVRAVAPRLQPPPQPRAAGVPFPAPSRSPYQPPRPSDASQAPAATIQDESSDSVAPAPADAEGSSEPASAAGSPDILLLGAAFETIAFTSAFELIPCLSLRATIALPAAFALQIGAQLGSSHLDGSLEISDGRQSVQLRLTIASLVVAGLYIARLGNFDLALGVGGRLGVAYLAGIDPKDERVTPQQSWAPWAGPLVTTHLAYRVTSQLRFTLTVELGIVALGTRATAPSNVVAELRDAWLAGSLGLAWSL